MTNDLRCYCCGIPITGIFYLVAMTKEADRVFIVEEKCINAINKEDRIVQIRIDPHAIAPSLL